MSPSAPVLDRVGSRLSGLSTRADALRLRLMPRLALTERVEPEVAADGDWTFLRRPALLGFIAIVSICVGASLPSSPFKLEMGGTWFFGEATWPTTALMLPGVVAVYGGMVLLVRVWFGLYQALRARPNVPIRQLGYMLALWIVPLMAVAPLFSRDAFSYAAQGEMMSHHINPYHYGPGTLGSGPFVSGVDPQWANTPAPYGPLFLMLAGWSAALSLHHALITVLLLRVQAVAGVALIAYCIPKLARSFGKDPGPAFVLAVLNPLTLLALVGGAHNDALMVGLLLAGVTAARSRHPVWGIVLCALAAAIKVPAAMGIVYVAWDWAGPGAQWRDRARMLWRAGLVTVAVMGTLSLVSGLGWGWIANLGTPGTVRSWMAPATAVGLLTSGTAHVFGVGMSLAGALTVTRAIGLVGGGGHRALLPAPPRAHGPAVGARDHHARLRAARPRRAAVVPHLGDHHPGPDRHGSHALRHPRHLDGGAVHRPHRRRRPAEPAGAHGPAEHGPGRHGAVGGRHRPARGLDDLVAHRPLPPAGPPGAGAGRRRRSSPRAPATPPAHSSRCSSTTSSHWRCLRPTSRSTPTSSKPAAVCRPMECSLCPAMRAMTEWKPWAEASSKSSASRARPTPAAPLGPVDVDRILGGGRVPRALAEGGERAEAEDDLPVGPGEACTAGVGGSMATTAGWTPLCRRIQASCSAGERGTMSKVLVLSVTSAL